MSDARRKPNAWSSRPLRAPWGRRARWTPRAGLLAVWTALATLGPTPASAAAGPAWSDTAVSRLEALALIQTLSAEILASPSATSSLEQWCREHALARTPKIVAHRIDAAAEPPTAAQRQELQVDAKEPVRYRRVALACGEHVLSIAENWYVPSRLSGEMNRLLQNTETPFGIVVRPLAPHRETLEVKLLWAPLPNGWERNRGGLQPPLPAGTPLQVPAALFEHRALLFTAPHQAIAEVHEIYQRDLLAFPQPSL